MAGKNDSGERTEKPTPKKLRDARKKGDVPKSKEVTSTAGLLAWLLVGTLSVGLVGKELADLVALAFGALAEPSQAAMLSGMAAASGTIVRLVALLVLPVVALSLLAEFAQVGPVLSFEKVKPKLDKLNPAEGLKRMVSMDNLVEVLKALLKTTLILVIGLVVALSLMPDMMALPRASAGGLAAVLGRFAFVLVAATFAAFVLVAAVDAAYQRHSFTKKQRMSVRDIKQEHKESEGDPHLKSHRRQTAIEQAQSMPVRAARQASVLLTNPTHLAVALDYDKEAGTVPVMTAKAEGEVAAAMRRAAAEAGVPTLRDVRLARALYAAGAEGDSVPEALFDDVAAVLVWAEGLREAARAQAEEDA